MFNQTKSTTELYVFTSLEDLNSKGIKFLDETEQYHLLSTKLGVYPLMQLFEGDIDLRKFLVNSIDALHKYIKLYNIDLGIDETSFYLKYLIAWYRHSVGEILRSDIQSYYSLIPFEYPGTIEETFLRIILILETMNFNDSQISDLLEMDFETFINLISNILCVRNAKEDLEP